MRLRLEFQDAGLLRGSQRRQGLQKCWLQLPPSLATIADFSAYVHETFGLHHSCPSGIILSVDGFVLPLFISICILKDEDIIMIKKKGVIFEDSVIFCGSQNQENIQGRQISKLKNLNVATIGTLVDSHGGRGDRCKVHTESSQSKNMDELCMRTRFSTLHCSTKTVAIKNFQGDSLEDKENTGLDGHTAVHKETSSCGLVDAKLKKKHCSQHQTSENATMGFDDEHTSKKCVIGDVNKKPSRSASRKKAKRLWHRHHGSKKMKEGEETLQWNGRTEQKWGREKPFNKWNNDTSILLNNGESSGSKEAKELVEFSNEKSDVEEGEIYDESLVPNQEEPIKECGESKNFTVKEFQSAKQLIDFERFLPLVRLPEEGDVLVYRSLKTSSSSWCQEFSPFRVGRVSSYDCSTTKVILLPLPEYPHTPEKEMPGEGEESCCLYKEDGTLEVKLSSNVDVRLFKARESSDSTPTLFQ